MASRRHFLSTTLLASACMSDSGRSAEIREPRPEEALRAGLARVCITPREPVWLYGYASPTRFRPFADVLDDIHAHVLVFEDAEGERAALISADLCVLRQREETLLVDRIMDKTGLARRQILLNWSHTHSGPMLGDSDVNRYPIAALERERTMAYTDWLADRLAAATAEALGDVRPVLLAFGVGTVDFVKSRRQYDAQGRYLRMGPNPRAPVDRTVPVLRIDSPDGSLRALLFGCACHAVTLDAANNRLSGDYPSFARRFIEQRLPEVQSMFLTGCGADANPDPRGGPEQERLVRRHGRDLADEVCRVAAGPLRPVRGPLRTKLTWVALPLQPPPAPERLQELARGPFWESHNAKRMIRALAAGESLPDSYRAPIALWEFGTDLTVAAISGEVVSDYARLVPQALQRETVWVAGYSNQVFGYLPSARIVREGGYEALGFPSGPIGWFSEKAEAVVIDALRELADRDGTR